MSTANISFIGGGNIAEAILSGLVKHGHDPNQIAVADPYEPQLQKLSQKYKIRLATLDNLACLNAFGSDSPCDVVIIATKPQIVSTAIKQVAELIHKYKPLIISIAAGIKIESIYGWVTKDANLESNHPIPIARLMPNTLALIGEGAGGLIANQYVSQDQKEIANYVAGQITKQFFWFGSDSDIDSVTAISGSGPAYFFYVIEAMQEAAMEMGFEKDTARKLVAQTCLGAGKMVLDSPEEVSTLRQRVTSPNGTTYAAITCMESHHVKESIKKGCYAARDRSVEISEEFGNLP
ncbi:hypothetical protein BB560_003618 [Smittium megazygosporum]|uniref:Pyrroline-5-carboxylate reductase n=1 Tax=Smittium megazygosporum TaxID=133381 RepID=A0A2T9ZBH2_9FUNG|nr:hypothetical protein BB560_003618 [Smittium megazygosporum]